MNRYNIIAVLAAVPVFIAAYIFEPPLSWDTRAAFTLLLIAPVCEELFFRAVLQNYFAGKFKEKNVPELYAVFFVSVIFALLHWFIKGSILELLVFFPSVLLGWHYLNRKSIIAVILLHSFYNVAYFI